MSYSKGYTKEDHKLATRMSRLRKKISEGRATQMEKAELADYERKKGRRARPPEPEAPRPPTAPVIQETQAAQAAESPESPSEVQTGLPGQEGAQAFVPPPLSVSGVGAPSSNPAQPSSGTVPPPPSATTAAGTSSPKQAPAMSKEEAAMQGEMVANIATQILSEFNAFNIKNGAHGVADQFIKMFHFSVKRLATKYGAAIDEDQYDAMVIVGAGAFVGYNSYKAYSKQEKEKVIEMQPAPVQAVKQEEAPSNGSSRVGGTVGGPVDRAARTVYSGGPNDSVPRGFQGRREFDPNGPY